MTFWQPFLVLQEWFGHYFWLLGPMDARSTRLNCILQEHFRDAPFDHIRCAKIRAQIRPNTPKKVFGGIWVEGEYYCQAFLLFISVLVYHVGFAKALNLILPHIKHHNYCNENLAMALVHTLLMSQKVGWSSLLVLRSAMSFTLSVKLNFSWETTSAMWNILEKFARQLHNFELLKTGSYLLGIVRVALVVHAQDNSQLRWFWYLPSPVFQTMGSSHEHSTSNL